MSAEPRRFAILMEGRCGSTWLVSALNQHPDLLCYGEAFITRDKDIEKRWLDAFLQGGSPQEVYPRSADEFFFAPARLGDKTAPRAIGFKFKPNDILDLTAFRKRLETSGVHLVYLYRHNIVKAVLSVFSGQRMNEETGKEWNLHSYDRRYEPRPVTVNVEEFQGWMYARLLWERITRDFFFCYEGPRTSLSYENLFEKGSSTAALDSLLAFLGVEVRPLTGHMQKITAPRLRDAIENYEEIAAIFHSAPAGDPLRRFIPMLG